MRASSTAAGPSAFATSASLARTRAAAELAATEANPRLGCIPCCTIARANWPLAERPGVRGGNPGPR